MPHFAAEAYDKENVIKTFELDQPSRAAVIEFLKRNGLTPISIHQTNVTLNKINALFARKISVADKLIFSRHMSVLIKAGVSLFESIDLLNQNTSNRRMKKFLSEMLSLLEQGRPISTAFKNHPEIFDPIYIGTVEIGEASGTLEKSFDTLANQLEKQVALNRKVRGALTYPAILVFSVVSLVYMIITFVMPKIFVIFTSSNIKLPPLTLFLFGVSKIFQSNFLLATLVYFLIPIALIFLLASKGGRAIVLAAISRLPKISDLVEKVELARMSRSLHTMLSAGVPLLEALSISASTLTGTPYEKLLTDIGTDVRQGISLTVAMKKHKKFFPGVFSGIVSVGEKTGTIDDVLAYLSNYYEEEVNSAVDTMTAFIEPVMLVIIGIIILTIALSTLIPIYSLISNLS